MVSKDRGARGALNSYLREEACELVDKDVFDFISLLDSDREADGVDT